MIPITPASIGVCRVNLTQFSFIMSVWLTRMPISLEPNVGHAHVIPQLKALIFLYLTMKQIPRSGID